MFMRQGKKFNISLQQVIDGITYTSSDLAQPDVRARLGITEVPDPVRKDDRYYYITENEDGTLTQTKKPKAVIVAARYNDAKQIRDSVTSDGGCLVSGKWFHTDSYSKLQQLTLVTLGASIPAGIQWKTMDGSFIEVTPALLQELFAAQTSRELAIFNHCESLLAAMEASDTPELVDIQAGWPAVYTRHQA
jgi:hypothetical protein